ncbi:MAG: hypothetical protein R8G34_15485 [Paracoccaceae bacterium]|nr:hypothetical protein [Paracoccaceae bacterium]
MSFADKTGHNARTGIYRLHNAPRDAYTLRDYSNAIFELDDAPEVFRSAYGDFLEDITDALNGAMSHWQDQIDAQIEEGDSEKEAIMRLTLTMLGGPARHQPFISAIRRNWLAIQAISQPLPAEARWVAPETIMAKWPYDQKLSELVSVVSAMPYWPVGLDEDGNWC